MSRPVLWVIFLGIAGIALVIAGWRRMRIPGRCGFSESSPLGAGLKMAIALLATMSCFDSEESAGMNARLTGGVRDEQDKIIAISDEYAEAFGGGNLKDRLSGRRAAEVIPMLREMVKAAKDASKGGPGEGEYEFEQLLALAEEHPNGVFEAL